MATFWNQSHFGLQRSTLVSPRPHSAPLCAESHKIGFEVLSEGFAEAQSKDFSREGIGDEESAQDREYLFDDEHEKVASFEHTNKSGDNPFNPFGVPDKDRGSFVGSMRSISKKGGCRTWCS